MSLMVSPVSRVNFRGSEAQAVKPEQNIEDFLSRPGAYAKPEQTSSQKTKSKHKFLKAAAATIVAAGIVAGVLVGLHKGFPNVFDSAKSLDGLKNLKKIQAYITTGVAKGAEYIEQGADWLITETPKAFDSVLKFLKIRKA